MRTTSVFLQEYHDSFHHSFIDSSELTPRERAVLAFADAILAMARVTIKAPIVVSETMHVDEHGQTRGLWVSGRIIILREVLSSLEEFAGVLLHEAAHAESGAPDSSRAFEDTLTDFLGRLVVSVLPPRPAGG